MGMMECISHRYKLAMNDIDHKVKHADAKNDRADQEKKNIEN